MVVLRIGILNDLTHQACSSDVAENNATDNHANRHNTAVNTAKCIMLHATMLRCSTNTYKQPKLCRDLTTALAVARHFS